MTNFVLTAMQPGSTGGRRMEKEASQFYKDVRKEEREEKTENGREEEKTETEIRIYQKVLP